MRTAKELIFPFDAPGERAGLSYRLCLIGGRIKNPFAGGPSAAAAVSLPVRKENAYQNTGFDMRSFIICKDCRISPVPAGFCRSGVKHTRAVTSAQRLAGENGGRELFPCYSCAAGVRVFLNTTSRALDTALPATKHTPASTAPFIPTKRSTNINGFAAPREVTNSCI